jgi:hypothetical protein
MKAARVPRVELLWWEGCPSTPHALAELREEMERLGIDPGRVEMREVRTDGDAERERFVGSPTIRVDGAEVQAAADEPVGLSCRVYRTRDGRVAAWPDRTEVRAALQAAISGNER